MRRHREQWGDIVLHFMHNKLKKEEDLSEAYPTFRISTTTLHTFLKELGFSYKITEDVLEPNEDEGPLHQARVDERCPPDGEVEVAGLDGLRAHVTVQELVRPRRWRESSGEA
ncbi:hypothetical protein ANCCAN_21933 [Ancylostoma caninum]|uniref:Uncharacterized protein n=1 Tax=Ancylostoma caninum TaxID=29170 RepID=A0A368FN46_ANCCA|nr:hypothetical protein ANCCAN_21933 [Ancylostoma caninum]